MKFEISHCSNAIASRAGARVCLSGKRQDFNDVIIKMNNFAVEF